jgi:hypothetical protein
MKERIPFKSGDEYDALTKAKSIHIWRAGDRAQIKRRYNKRLRKTEKAKVKMTKDDARVCGEIAR